MHKYTYMELLVARPTYTVGMHGTDMLWGNFSLMIYVDA